MSSNFRDDIEIRQLNRLVAENVAKLNRESQKQYIEYLDNIQKIFIKNYIEKLKESKDLASSAAALIERKKQLEKLISGTRDPKKLKQYRRENRLNNEAKRKLDTVRASHNRLLANFKQTAENYIEYNRVLKGELEGGITPEGVKKLDSLAKKAVRLSKRLDSKPEASTAPEPDKDRQVASRGLLPGHEKRLSWLDSKLKDNSKFLQEFASSSISEQYNGNRSFFKSLFMMKRGGRTNQLNVLQQAINDLMQTSRAEFIKDPLKTLQVLRGEVGSPEYPESFKIAYGKLKLAIGQVLHEIKQEKANSGYLAKSSLEEICVNMCNKLGVNPDVLVTKFEESKAKKEMSKRKDPPRAREEEPSASATPRSRLR